MKCYKVFLLFLALTLTATAQDIRTNIFGNNGFLASGFSWGDAVVDSAAGRAFIYRPSTPNVSLTITLRNNNPTNSHTFAFQVWQTTAADIPGFTGFSNQWVQSQTTGVGFCFSSGTVVAASSVSCNISLVGAAQFAVIVASAAPQAGTPDTFDVIVNQTNNTALAGIGNAAPNVQGAQSGAGTAILSTNPFPMAVTSNINGLITPVAPASLGDFPTSLTTTGRNSFGTVLTEKGSRWGIFSIPAVGSTGVASIPAEIVVRHVLDCITFSAASSGGASAATNMNITVSDGGSTIWAAAIALPAAAAGGVQLFGPYTVCNLNLVGTTNALLSASFSFGVANVQESVSMSGYNVN